MRRIPFRSAALLLSLSLLVGCGPSDSSDTGDTGVDTSQGPEISNVSVTENPNNRLSATVNFETDVAAESSVVIRQSGETLQTVGPADADTTHDHLVLGLQAESDYTFRLEASANGETATRMESFSTRSLPSDMPPLQVEASNPDLAADGIRLLDAFRWNDDNTGSDDDWGMIIGVNKRGEVVWYYQADHQVWDASRIDNGNIIYNAEPHSIVEIDMAGNIVNEWKANEDLGRELSENEFSVHHGIRQLDNGEFLTLSTELRQIDNYIEQGSQAPVVGDVGLQFNRDGEVTGSWSMFDVLSDYRTRKRVGSTGPYWDSDYETETNDWTHGNAIEPGDEDGTLIASLRHQDWVIKWDRETGDLLWRLGPEGDFEFASNEGEFNYHQHAPIWLENGNLLVYDNGNARPTIEQGDQYYTRVVEYDIDASNVDIGAGDKGTVEQVWEYRNPPEYYAPYVGDADELPNGNILIGDGGLLSDPGSCIEFDDQGEVVDNTGACISSADNQKWARILEVTHDSDKKKALELHMRDDAEQNPRGYTMYRSSHIDSLYPDQNASN